MRQGERPRGARGRRAAAGLAVAAAAAVLPALRPPPAQADGLGSGALFHVDTTATGITVTSTQRPALSIVTAGLVDSAVAYAASTVDGSGGARARAAAYFPGDLVVQGPALLCQLTQGCPTEPPAYPLLADASYPTQPHDHVAAADRSGGQAPVSLVAGEGDATAGEQAASAATRAASVQALPGTPAAVTAAASTARTTTSVRADGVHVTVESVLHDVSVAGLLHVGTLRVVDEIVVAPGRKPRDVPSVTLAGVSFAGQPATVDDHGVHVAGHHGPSPAASLARQGVSVTLVGASRSDTGAAARSTAQGLLVTFAVPVSGLPYVPNPVPCPDGFPFCVTGANVNATYLGTIVLGSAGAAVDVEPGLGLGGLGLPPTGAATRAPGAAGGVATTAPAGTTVSASSPSARAPVVAAGPAPSPQRLLAGLLRVPLDALYAVLALVTISGFVGWRATMSLVAGRGR